MREIRERGVISPTIRLQAELEKLRQETEDNVRHFLEANSLRYVLALIGDSDSQGEAVVRNRQILEEFFDYLPDRSLYAIQTGGTEGGLPQYGLELAKEFDLPTIGVYPAAASKYALHEPEHTPADLVVETPDIIYGKTTFGSETPVFVNLLDAALVLGGGYGTRTEASTILKVNKGRVRDIRSVAKKQASGELVDAAKIASLRRPIYLCPIEGTGKTAEELTSSAPLEDIGDSMPNPAVRTGEDAARFISDRLTS